MSLRRDITSYLRSLIFAGGTATREEWGHTPSDTGISVTGESALTYSAWWAGVTFISTQCAMIPLKLYKVEGEDKQPYSSHPLYWLLHDEPNPLMSSFTLRECLIGHALNWGTGYAEIERKQDGSAAALWLLTPDRVNLVQQPGQEPFYRVANPVGPAATVPLQDMFVLSGPSYDGVVGWCVREKAKQAIGLGLAAEKFGAVFFKNGGTFRDILEVPKEIKEKGKEYLRAQLDHKHTGLSKHHRTLILEEGVTWKQAGSDPKNSQYVDTRKLSVLDICRFLQIPPHKLRSMESSTFASIESEQQSVLSDALAPWLHRIAIEANLKLIPMREKGRQVIEHVTQAFLKPDAGSRADYYTKMFSMGAMTLNQIARLENLPSVGADGDTRFVPANLITLQRALKEPEPAPDPEPEPEPEPEPTDQDAPEDDARAVLVMRTVLADAVGRLVRRAQTRYARVGEDKRESWHAEYWASERDHIARCLAPAVAVQQMRGSELTVEQASTRYVSMMRASMDTDPQVMTDQITTALMTENDAR